MVDKLGFDKSEEKRMFLQAKLRTAKKEALLGGWGGGMYIVCLQSELAYNRFHVSRSKPRRYLTHLYVICRHFIKSYVTVLRPSFLLEFYPNMASRKPSNLSSHKPQHVPINNASNQSVHCKKTSSLVLDILNFDTSIDCKTVGFFLKIS